MRYRKIENIIIKVYNKSMKKLLTAIIFSALTTLLFALPSDNIQEYTLENGLTAFVLEDSSTPLVRIEYTVRAGFSNQTQNTSGFFKLYANLIKATLTGITLDSVQCNADSSRFIITTTPSNTPQVLSRLAQSAFTPDYSDEVLSSELNELKKEVRSNALDPSGILNAAIDSRVFSNAPWKHDMGVYPAIFNGTTEAKARTILSTIGQNFYTPQNSAVFVSGNISNENALQLIKETFGAYYSTHAVPEGKTSIPLNRHKKYVIHHPDLSDEMTQVVIQYTMLDMEEAEVMAEMLNNNFSTFKTNVLQHTELNIPGDVYIDAAAAHKKDSTRLIIQTLMLSDSKGAASLEKAQGFFNQVLPAITSVNPSEFYFAQQRSAFKISNINSSSSELMDQVSAFWTYEPYQTLKEQVMENPVQSITAQKLFSRSQKVQETSLNHITSVLASEEPFIFIITNSSEYKKHKKEYDAAGYEEVNSKNAAWYNQEAFKEILNDKQSDEKIPVIASASDSDTAALNFYKTNISHLKKSELINGIPLITKYNDNTSEIAVVISIAGGKLNSANDHGLEEVMVNLLANNIDKEIYLQQQQGIILGNPVTDWNSDITSSYIILTCEKEDFNACCKAISNALIYGEIIPAAADRAVASRQYRKRLENGSAEYQMYSAVINELYPKSDFAKIFDSKKDVLQQTNYQKILEAYPSLLDASRFKLIVTGCFEDNVYDSLNSAFGLLAKRNLELNAPAVKSNFPKDKSVNVKIQHTFLTDIPAEKAGPQPAVLIPTTEFLDPVIYVMRAPERGVREEALFNMLLCYLQKTLQKNVDSNKRLKGCTIKYEMPRSQTDFAFITAQNVMHTKELDALFRLSVEEISKALESKEAHKILQEMKDLWISKTVADFQSNSATALLLQKGLEYSPSSTNAEYYLEMYRNVTSAELPELINTLNLFPQKPNLRFYSKDSQK